VRAVQLDGVKAEALGVAGGAREGRDGVGDVGVAHPLAELLVRPRQARRAVIGPRRGPILTSRAHRADVPELRRHHAAGGVHLVDHRLPGGKFGLAMEARHVRIVQRGRPGRPRALGNDQADLALRATAVIGGDVVGGHAARRLRTGHRRHNHAVGKLQTLEAEGFEQSVGGHGRLQARG
jgi:hypothetical protein